MDFPVIIAHLSFFNLLRELILLLFTKEDILSCLGKFGRKVCNQISDASESNYECIRNKIWMHPKMFSDASIIGEGSFPL